MMDTTFSSIPEDDSSQDERVLYRRHGQFDQQQMRQQVPLSMRRSMFAAPGGGQLPALQLERGG